MDILKTEKRRAYDEFRFRTFRSNFAENRQRCKRWTTVSYSNFSVSRPSVNRRRRQIFIESSVSFTYGTVKLMMEMEIVESEGEKMEIEEEGEVEELVTVVEVKVETEVVKKSKV